MALRRRHDTNAELLIKSDRNGRVGEKANARHCPAPRGALVEIDRDGRLASGPGTGHEDFPLQQIRIIHFSDVLCVWAYFAEARLAAVRRTFGDQVQIRYRFCPVFGDVAGKIAAGWKDRGGYDGFADHVQHAGKAFPELSLHPDLWRAVRPASSLSPHLFLKAIEGAEKDGHCAPGAFEHAIRLTRATFFERGRNIAHAEVQRAIAEALGFNIAILQRILDEGEAHAALSADYKEAETLDVKGSPTMILNEGRQKLYGNVGYRIIEANIQELLREPNPDQASWC
jgi:predicted DsbA family dithiol-disulfide isomerase